MTRPVIPPAQPPHLRQLARPGALATDALIMNRLRLAIR
jgi:hypothetical protein